MNEEGAVFAMHMTNIEYLLKQAIKKYEAMTPEEKEKMWAAQRASWAKQDKD